MLSVEGGKTAVRNAQRNLRHIHLAMSMRVWAMWRKHLPTYAMISLSQMWWCLIHLVPALGCAKVCRQIAEAEAKSAVYIACDPASLARDTATLVSLGYELADIRAFDIYPMTHHVGRLWRCSESTSSEHAIIRMCRAFFGMTAIALSCAALSGCVPSNAAVGDTQSPDTAVAHSMEDRDSLSSDWIG